MRPGWRPKTEATHAKADLTGTEALIAHLKLAIEKLRRALYGSRSERQARLLGQMELELEELEAAASEDEIAAEATAAAGLREYHPYALPQAPFTALLPGAPAARARRDRGADGLPVLRISAAVEARRGRDRDAGSGAAPLEGDPDRARALQLSRLRADHATAGAVPRHAAPVSPDRNCWPRSCSRSSGSISR